MRVASTQQNVIIPWRKTTASASFLSVDSRCMNEEIYPLLRTQPKNMAIHDECEVRYRKWVGRYDVFAARVCLRRITSPVSGKPVTECNELDVMMCLPLEFVYAELRVPSAASQWLSAMSWTLWCVCRSGLFTPNYESRQRQASDWVQWVGRYDVFAARVCLRRITSPVSGKPVTECQPVSGEKQPRHATGHCSPPQISEACPVWWLTWVWTTRWRGEAWKQSMILTRCILEQVLNKKWVLG